MLQFAVWIVHEHLNNIWSKQSNALTVYIHVLSLQVSETRWLGDYSMLPGLHKSQIICISEALKVVKLFPQILEYRVEEELRLSHDFDHIG